MVYPLENYLIWAARYDIQISKGKCPKCGIDIVTSIPFAVKGYRGLKSEDHGCGDKLTRKTIVPVDAKEIEYWSGIARSM